MRAKLGSIYQRKKRMPDGSQQTLPTWWIKYTKGGQVFRESSGSEKRADAEKLLMRRAGEIATGRFAGLGIERIQIAELFQDEVDDYKASDRKTLRDLNSRLSNHLTPFFGEIRAADFSTQHVRRYVTKRREEEATNGTINRELTVLRRAFSLAFKCDPPKITRMPHIQMLKENNVRTGFLEYAEYLALRDELPWYVRPLFVTAYHVGGRRGELASVKWPQVDFNTNQIRLHATDTKNEEARTLPIYGEMREWLLIAKDIRDKKFPKCPWVFYTDEGDRLYWFRKSWTSACTRVGKPTFLFHDLRRSAVRNMERAGVPRKVAMSISGHKTENIYRRYDIVAERDLSDASTRMDVYFTAMKARLRGEVIEP
jgi:integrase